MSDFTKEQLKNIAEELDIGFRVFYHKKTGAILQIPGRDMYLVEMEEEEEELENNFEDYEEVLAMESRDSFRIMEDFAEHLSDRIPLKHRLFSALNQNKPFARFKQEIDHSGEYRQQWFEFKLAKQVEWVERQIKINQDYEIRHKKEFGDQEE